MDDLRFSVARVLSNKHKLEEFVEAQSRFTTSLVLGDLAGSRAELINFETRFGVSSWLLEARLLLADTEGGFEQIRDELTQILELPIPQNAMVIAEFASQRVDMTMSVVEYMRRIQEMASGEEYAKFDPSLPSYLCFVGAVPQIGFRSYTLEEASFILRTESVRPVIDHYQSIKRLLRFLSAGDDKFLSSDAKYGPIDELAEIRDGALSFARLISDRPETWSLDLDLIETQKQILDDANA